MGNQYIIKNKKDYGSVEYHISKNKGDYIAKRDAFNLKVEPYTYRDEDKFEKYLKDNKIEYTQKSSFSKTPKIDEYYKYDGKIYKVDEVHSDKVYVYNDKGDLSSVPKENFGVTWKKVEKK